MGNASSKKPRSRSNTNTNTKNKPVILRATLPFCLDDTLKPTQVWYTERPPTKFTKELEALTRKNLARHNYSKDVAQYVLTSKHGTLRKHALRKEGQHLVWDFEWVLHRKVPLEEVKRSISGGVSDGWGEGAEQSYRFGPIVLINDNTNKRHLATKKEISNFRKSNNWLTRERALQRRAGRYCALLTLKGARFQYDS